MNISIPKDVKYIIDTFYNNGYEAFMVGGCIRDILLNKNPADYDIATSAPPEITEKLFDKTIPTGIEHGTITVIINKKPYEITTYRLEGKYSDNRKPDSVIFISNIKEDLARRDFTINAFAYNHKSGLLDYFSGNIDLNNSIIRCVGDADKRFKEDALRMLRAIRFASQLNFSIEEKTFAAILSNSFLIKHISKERIKAELFKIILSDNSYYGMTKLFETNLLKSIISFNLNISPKLDILCRDISTRLAYLFLYSDINIVQSTLKTLTCDNDTINKVLLLLRSYSLIDPLLSKCYCKRLIISVKEDNIFNLIHLYEVANDIPLINLTKSIKNILATREPLYIKDLSINGNILKNELNIKPGKILGDILNYLINSVIDETISNNPDELLLAAKEYYNKKIE